MIKQMAVINYLIGFCLSIFLVSIGSIVVVGIGIKIYPQHIGRSISGQIAAADCILVILVGFVSAIYPNPVYPIVPAVFCRRCGLFGGSFFSFHIYAYEAGKRTVA